MLEELLAWVVRLSGNANSTECTHMASIYLDWLQKVNSLIFMHTLFFGRSYYCYFYNYHSYKCCIFDLCRLFYIDVLIQGCKLVCSVHHFDFDLSLIYGRCVQWMLSGILCARI